MKYCLGGRRQVLLIKRLAIKFPRIDSWVSFIKGVTENLEERYWWSADGSRNKHQIWRHEYLAEIIWADRFGIILIMRRLDTEFVNYNEFKNDLKNLCSKLENYSFSIDIREENVGYNEEGVLQVLDYGWHGGSRDCYLGS